MQNINTAKKNIRIHREKKLMLNIAELLLKEDLITFNEKMLLAILIKEGND